jgi:hypothetical protein
MKIFFKNYGGIFYKDEGFRGDSWHPVIIIEKIGSLRF